MSSRKKTIQEKKRPVTKYQKECAKKHNKNGKILLDIHSEEFGGNMSVKAVLGNMGWWADDVTVTYEKAQDYIKEEKYGINSYLKSLKHHYAKKQKEIAKKQERLENVTSVCRSRK